MKYTGGCHCGEVRFEVEMTLDKVITCNCSYCAKKGLLLGFTPATQFTLQKGADAQTSYHFNKKVINHLFCRTCGTQSFSEGKDKEGLATVAINVRSLDDVDLTSITLTPVDGKNW